eukprot:2597643-Pleurochrysis_carterae.AAC.1
MTANAVSGKLQKKVYQSCAMLWQCGTAREVCARAEQRDSTRSAVPNAGIARSEQLMSGLTQNYQCVGRSRFVWIRIDAP